MRVAIIDPAKRAELAKIVFAVLMCLGMYACWDTHMRARDVDSWVPRTGKDAWVRIKTQPTEPIPVATSESAYERLMSAAGSNDTWAISQLIADGSAFNLLPQTKVLVLDANLFTSEIRVLEGEHLGRSVWIRTDFLAASR